MFKIHNIINDPIASKWLNDYLHLKLFPNRKDIRFHNTVLGKMHEGVVEDIMKLSIEIRSVDLSIIHHGYETSDRLDSKIQRDIRICMNQPGYYYQFKIGNKFFVFNGYKLSMWEIKAGNNETLKISTADMLFSSKDEMSVEENVALVECANKMIVDQKSDFDKYLNLLESEIMRVEKSCLEIKSTEVSL
jgi:hypothetical protein